MKPILKKPLTLRPADASIEALRGCMRWLDECVAIGWKKDQMAALESMWWEYHDKDGKRL